MLADLFGAFLIYSVGVVTGLLILPLLARALIKMLQRRVKR